MTSRHWTRLGLRQRVSVMFGLGAFVTSVVLAVTTYLVAADYLWTQRHTATIRQAALSARTIEEALMTRQSRVERLLDRLEPNPGQSSPGHLMWWQGNWYDDHLRGGHQALPDLFLAAAKAGDPVTQRFRLADDIVVGVAVPVTGGSYVEVFSLQALDRTLGTLGAIFTGTATMTTVLGWLLGGWASRRSLRPLTSVTAAAAAIAEGDLGARLHGQPDKDLSALADAFNRTAARLQARVERDSRFAANVSHELRSPLTTMVNAVDMLKARADPLNAEGKELLDLLAGDVHRFARMVDDLLDISRADMQAASLHREPVRLAQFVRRVADRSTERPVTITTQGVDPVVRIDRRRMERVLANLVRNAETHGRGVTSLSVTAHGPKVQIAVEDRGPGIPPEERQRVFERFARSAQARSYDDTGVGLGLALVVEHTRLHGGRVWVEEAPGGGARFVVELPLEPA